MDLITKSFARLSSGSLEMLVVVAVSRLRAKVHDATPAESLVHITLRGTHLHIFCRRRPLLLALMFLRRESYDLYKTLSKYFRENSRDVVWPVTAPPPPRVPPLTDISDYFQFGI